MIRRPPGSTLFPYTTLLPIYRGKSAQELLAAFSDQPERSGYDLVKDYWQQRHTSADFEADRKSTRLNSSHGYISYAVFCLKKKKKTTNSERTKKTYSTQTQNR